MCLGTSESSESFACICPSLATPQLQPTRMQTASTLTRWCLVTVCWAPRTTSNRHLSCIHAVQGEHAHRVWSAIYDQSCFSNLNDTETCQEQRIFYRLISGGHALYACLALTPLHSTRLVRFHTHQTSLNSLYHSVKRRRAQAAHALPSAATFLCCTCNQQQCFALSSVQPVRLESVWLCCNRDACFHQRASLP